MKTEQEISEKIKSLRELRSDFSPGGGIWQNVSGKIDSLDWVLEPSTQPAEVKGFDMGDPSGDRTVITKTEIIYDVRDLQVGDYITHFDAEVSAIPNREHPKFLLKKNICGWGVTFSISTQDMNPVLIEQPAIRTSKPEPISGTFNLSFGADGFSIDKEGFNHAVESALRANKTFEFTYREIQEGEAK